LAVSVMMLEPVADGLGLKFAVTPLGNPEAEKVTLPVNPFAGVTKTVLVMLLPCVTDRLGANGESVKLGPALTVRAIVVDAFTVTEVPLMVIFTGPPTVAAPLAVSVSKLVLVAGLGAKVAVTPLGRPEAARVTPPVNPLTGVIVMVVEAVLPWVTDRLDANGESVKLGGGVTVRAIVVDSVRAPEVPLTTTFTGPPRVAVLLAVSVSTLVLVAGLVAKLAVTPLGRPAAASVTLPVNPPTSVMVMVSVLLLPWATDRVGAEDESVKPVPMPVIVTAPVLLA